MAGWADFFVAEVGASAALAGFVIVAISINLTRIIAYPWLPGRAAETLVGAHRGSGGFELYACPGPAAGSACDRAFYHGRRDVADAHDHPNPYLARRGGGTAPLAGGALRFVSLFQRPILIAGALMLKGDPNAIAWMVPGIIVSLVATVINAWVLLVEIVR